MSKTNSVFNQFIAELRDEEIQKDSMRFRRNLERVGEILAYELSKKLNYEKKIVTSPLGEAEMELPSDPLVLATILRAGLPLHQGLLNYFDSAENAFVSAYRKYTTEKEFDVHMEYIASARIDGKVLIIADPMLATGTSVELVYKGILSKGTPSRTVVVSAVASKDGLMHIKRLMPPTTDFYIGAVDDELTAKSYIVPGLGDAGDLAFGNKD